VQLPVDPGRGFSYSGVHQPPDEWWKSFDDLELNRLIEKALASNFELESVWHRFREAQAVVRRERSALFPLLDAEGQAELRRTDSRTDEQLLMGLFAAYEVDLWGRIRASVQAERERARATLYDYRTAAISLSAEVARTWYRLITARDQRELLRAQLATNERVLKLIRSRFRAGLVRAVDILRQEQLVEATRERMIVAESRVEVLQHLLAVLLGRPPREEFEFAEQALPALPPLPETGLPVELIRRRPDLQREYHLLQAADRELAAAISRQYPRLTLSTSLSIVDVRTEELFSDWLAVLGADLFAPVFDAGRREAEVERSEAVRDQRLSQYAQETLGALREVEDALVREIKQRSRITSLERQIELADLASERLRQEYFNGFGDYIDVLRALTEEQELRRDLLAARSELLEFRIALYRALAGSFETEREIEEID